MRIGRKRTRQFITTSLVLALLVPTGLSWGWGGDPVGLSIPPDLSDLNSRLVAALPLPPPPISPLQPELAMPAPPEDEISPEEPEPDLPLVLDDPVLEDPRAEVLSLASRLGPPPAPPYPMVVNETVESMIDFYRSDQSRERFALYLARSGKYLEMIKGILRARGLPEELAYTALVESGFSPRAVSRAGAHGLWQFMEATARRYGLVINRWVDERLDPIKSTVAAAEYLRDLFGQFGHWFLAQAAYNAGEAKLARAIQRARTTDFWSLVRTRYLQTETKRFVPSILAATLIARDPERYGFEVSYDPPFAFDEVAVRQAMDLETIASLAGVPVDEVRDLNPALKSGVTPLQGEYRVRLPKGSGAHFERALAQLPPDELVVWGVHRVKPGQGLREIARLYQTSPERLVEINRLPRWHLRRGMELLVPVSQRVEEKRPPIQLTRVPRKEGRTVHVVRRGDTLWRIASLYGMEVEHLARLNGLALDDVLHPGDRLQIRAQ